MDTGYCCEAKVARWVQAYMCNAAGHRVLDHTSRDGPSDDPGDDREHRHEQMARVASGLPALQSLDCVDGCQQGTAECAEWDLLDDTITTARESSNASVRQRAQRGNHPPDAI